MKKVHFNITGSMQVPDDVIFHYNVAGKLYAYENDGVMYMLQICIIGEGGAGGIDTITDYADMENHGITNVRYDDAEFGEIISG